MKDKKNKEFPVLGTDKEAEEFLDNADLSDYDFSKFKPVNFEFQKKTETINLRLPNALLVQIKSMAKKRGLPYSRLIREILEARILGESV